MFRPARFFAASIVGTLLFADLKANEITSTETARAFWNAFLDGDADAMGHHYGPLVTVKAGSELLKPEYTVNESGERGTDLIADRKSVIRGYHIMFQRVGIQKWKDSAQRLRNVQITFVAAADHSRYFAMFQGQPGDLLVQIHTEPEPLFFLMRQDERRRWRVIAEAFD